MPEALPISFDVPSRKDVLRRHRESGGRVAAVYPIHHPRALWRAFGVLPMEVWGPPGVDTGPADAHLQAYTCNIIRNGLSFLLSGGLDETDLVVVPHGCDSLQGLGSLLLDFVKPKQPVLTLYLPRGDPSDTEKAVRFFADEFRSVGASLEAITGRRPSDADLAAAIESEEKAARCAGDLLRERRRLPLDDRDFYRLLRSREFLPAESFEAMAVGALAQRTQTSRAGTPVVVSGILPEPAEFLDALNRAGGFVAGDDLVCTGRRVYPPGKDADPFRRMAEGILTGCPDSTRGSSVERRIEHLKRLCADAGARGVIFYSLKFCEPELFYLPQIRQALGDAGIRSVFIEEDLGRHLPHQTATRIEAFLETLA
jgi:benzoyl-CoA reductase/2-hydroxyglutaryl-CoA dehydratase subunit BcrC/BadD/HgdB